MKREKIASEKTLAVLRQLSLYAIGFFSFCFLLFMIIYFYSETTLTKGFVKSGSILSLLIVVIDCLPSYHRLKNLSLDKQVVTYNNNSFDQIRKRDKALRALSFVPAFSIILLIVFYKQSWLHLSGIMMGITLISGIFLAFELIQKYLLDILNHEIIRESRPSDPT